MLSKLLVAYYIRSQNEWGSLRVLLYEVDNVLLERRRVMLLRSVPIPVALAGQGGFAALPLFQGPRYATQPLYMNNNT